MVTAQKAMKIVGIIMVVGLCSKVFGFIRELVIANHFGVSAAMDACNVASNIPDILLSGIGTAVATTFIPAFTQKVEKEGKEAALALSRKLFTLFSLTGLFICILGVLFSEPLTHLVAPKFMDSQILLAATLTKIFFLAGAVSLVSEIGVGFLQAQEHFIIPSFINYPFNITLIAIILLFSAHYGIYALALASVVATLAKLILVLPNMIKTGFYFSLSFDLKDPDLLRVVRLILPVFAGTLLLQVNTIVTKAFASGLPVGSISALSYAGKINAIIVSIIATDIVTISLPTLAQAAAANDLAKLRRTMLQAVRGINLVVIPVTTAIVVLRVPLIRFIYQRGVFDAEATAMTASALCYLSLGLFAYGLREIFSRAFYTLNDTLTPMINSGVTIALNVILLVLLTPLFGMAGLAAATSISGIFSGIQLLMGLRHKIGSVCGMQIAVSFLKVCLASLLMGVIITWVYPLIRSWNPGPGFVAQGVVLFITIAVSSPFYLIGLSVFKAEELTIIGSFIRQKCLKSQM